MKKILYVSTVDITIDAFLIPHIKALQKRGFDVQVACCLGDKAPNIQSAGIVTHNIPFRRKYLSPMNIVALSKLRRLIKSENFDLVHVHTPVAAFIGRLAAKSAGGEKVKTLYTAHGLHFNEEGSGLSNSLFLKIEKLASRWTDALIVINREDYKAAKEYKLAPEEELFYIKGIGVDTEKYKDSLTPNQKDDLRKELGCPTGKIVGMIAEFNPEKRHIDLINAVPKILKEYKDTNFLFVGNGHLCAELQANTISKKHEKKIKFLGYREDIPKLLNIMDIFVLPSVREGLPRSIQEAMVAGKPVVAADVRGSRDLIINRETGLLVPSCDPDALAEAVLSLIKDKGLAVQIGERARDFAVKELGIDKIVPETVEIQETLLNKDKYKGK